MKPLHEQALGAIVIAGLLALGLLASGEPERSRGWDLLTQSAPPSLGSVARIDWSADGDRILCQSRGGASALPTLSVHEADARRRFNPVWIQTFGGSIGHASLFPDGQSIVLGTQTGELWQIELSTSWAEELAHTPDGTPLAVTAVSPDGRQVAAATNLGTVFVCDLDLGTTVLMQSTRDSGVAELSFSPDAARILCTRTDGSLTLWSTITGESIGELWGGERLPAAADFHPDGHEILCFPRDESIQSWDADRSRVTSQGVPSAAATFGNFTLDVDATGTLAAWGSGIDKRIMVWDLARQKKRLEIDNPAVVLQLRFSPDGGRLAVAGRETRIRIYDLTRGGLELPSLNVGDLVADDIE